MRLSTIFVSAALVLAGSSAALPVERGNVLMARFVDPDSVVSVEAREYYKSPELYVRSELPRGRRTQRQSQVRESVNDPPTRESITHILEGGLARPTLDVPRPIRPIYPIRDRPYIRSPLSSPGSFSGHSYFPSTPPPRPDSGFSGSSNPSPYPPSSRGSPYPPSSRGSPYPPSNTGSVASESSSPHLPPTTETVASASSSPHPPPSTRTVASESSSSTHHPPPVDSRSTSSSTHSPPSNPGTGSSTTSTSSRRRRRSLY